MRFFPAQESVAFAGRDIRAPTDLDPDVWSAAGDCRDDAHGLAVGDRSFETLQVANIVICDEQVDEPAQSTLVVEQTILEAGMYRFEIGQHVCECRTGDFDSRIAARERTQCCRNANGDGHTETLSPWSVFTKRTRQTDRVRIAAAVDKFKGTATAHEVARAIGHACWELGYDCDEIPLADGGEGTLDILGGANRTSMVTGPLGVRVEAQWRFHDDTAVIEMARASGLTLAGGLENNDPVRASTIGTGELIDRALDLGAARIIVCLGGSATTDGGLGALDAIRSPARLKAVDFVVACDVSTTFTDAARVFGPQKGATPTQVRLLTNRLEQLAQRYHRSYGVDITSIEGGGAAGGLAGALAALGARLVPGFDMIADEVNLDERITQADLVITGEGCFDATSVEGKVVGGVIDTARYHSKPVAGIFGKIDLDDILDAHIDRPNSCFSISETYGEQRALSEPLWCIEHAALEIMRAL